MGPRERPFPLASSLAVKTDFCKISPALFAVWLGLENRGNMPASALLLEKDTVWIWLGAALPSLGLPSQEKPQPSLRD